ncbi:MAG: hypothetical protein M0002_16180 [Rhodospirillales bacterium]|nr:hypothetical protein [Rhodospirillales bacterium]
MGKLYARPGVAWLVAAIGVALVAACAPLPKDIKPAAVSAVPYESESCTQLAAEQGQLASTLTSEAAKESADREKDATAIFWLGMPLQSWLGGNEAKKIAILKGQQAAVAEAEAHNSCQTVAAPSPGQS